MSFNNYFNIFNKKEKLPKINNNPIEENSEISNLDNNIIVDENFKSTITISTSSDEMKRILLLEEKLNCMDEMMKNMIIYFQDEKEKTNDMNNKLNNITNKITKLDEKIVNIENKLNNRITELVNKLALLETKIEEIELKLKNLQFDININKMMINSIENKTPENKTLNITEYIKSYNMIRKNVSCPYYKILSQDLFKK